MTHRERFYRSDSWSKDLPGSGGMKIPYEEEMQGGVALASGRQICPYKEWNQSAERDRRLEQSRWNAAHATALVVVRDADDTLGNGEVGLDVVRRDAVVAAQHLARR